MFDLRTAQLQFKGLVLRDVLDHALESSRLAPGVLQGNHVDQAVDDFPAGGTKIHLRVLEGTLDFSRLLYQPIENLLLQSERLEDRLKDHFVGR